MYLFGKKALIDNITNPKIKKVFIYKPSTDILSSIKKHHIQCEILRNDYFFKKFNANLNHQNIAILIDENKELSLKEFLENNKDKKQLLFLILDNIEDPQNFGAILRTADGFGVDGVIYKKNNQVQINDLVAKTSMGAVANLNLFRVTNLVNEINLLKKYGFWIYASALDDKSVDYSSVKYDNKTALIVGNENNGISPY